MHGHDFSSTVLYDYGNQILVTAEGKAFAAID